MHVADAYAGSFQHCAHERVVRSINGMDGGSTTGVCEPRTGITRDRHVADEAALAVAVRRYVSPTTAQIDTRRRAPNHFATHDSSSEQRRCMCMAVQSEG